MRCFFLIYFSIATLFPFLVIVPPWVNWLPLSGNTSIAGHISVIALGFSGPGIAAATIVTAPFDPAPPKSKGHFSTEMETFRKDREHHLLLQQVACLGFSLLFCWPLTFLFSTRTWNRWQKMRRLIFCYTCVHIVIVTVSVILIYRNAAALVD